MTKCKSASPPECQVLHKQGLESKRTERDTRKTNRAKGLNHPFAFTIFRSPRSAGHALWRFRCLHAITRACIMCIRANHMVRAPARCKNRKTCWAASVSCSGIHPPTTTSAKPKPSFFSRIGHFLRVFGGFLERRIPGKNGEPLQDFSQNVLCKLSSAFDYLPTTQMPHSQAYNRQWPMSCSNDTRGVSQKLWDSLPFPPQF